MKIEFVSKKSFLSEESEKAKRNVGSVLIFSEESIKKCAIRKIQEVCKYFDFKAKFGEMQNLSFQNEVITICGIGKEKEIDEIKLQKIGGKIANFANSTKLHDVNVFFMAKISEDGGVEVDDNPKYLCDIGLGAMLGSYRFNKYFKDKIKGKEFNLEKFNLVCDKTAEAKKEFRDYEILAQNTFFVRDLVSEPSNVLNPESYAEICKGLKKSGLEVEILGEKEMTKLGMNALLGVGQGSRKESKLVVLKWNGGKKGEKPLAFVGKGVTFDTGGISIKPSNNMEDMKTDMGGSAVVVGLLKNLAERKAKVNAVGVVGLVENMPDGNAQRPGDVVESMSGQTIEIINTDAEGRLVLADALHYTNTKFEPKFIVDLATLTGAVIVCLADVHAGLFANDEKLAQKLLKSGEKTDETLWRLPISKEYDEMINSDIADMKNVGSGRGAGSTTAAQFLQRFTGKTPWAHLDIAGVAWKGKGNPTAIKGASGFGLALLNRFVKDNYEK